MKKFRDANHILQMKPFRDIIIENLDIISKLNDLANNVDSKIIYNRSVMIKQLIKYNVPGSWVDRLNDSIKYGRDSTSLDSYISRYGDVFGKIMHDERIKLLEKIHNKEEYIKRHGEEKWIELCNSKTTFTEGFYIKKYGKKIGKQKWQETLTKKLKTQKENFKDKKWKNGLTLDEYQNRYGIEDGYNRWDTKRKKQIYSMSLDGCVDKYGVGKGENRYKLLVEQKIKNLNSGKRNYSKISQEMFDSIHKKLNMELQLKCKYATNDGEERFFMNNKLVLIDFKCGNKIIEFDGDYWHKSDETKSYDKIKQTFLENKRYVFLRIKESDYISDKQNVINKCVNFINETA